MEIYQALGLVDISVEPPFEKIGTSGEFLIISQENPLNGVRNGSSIICNKDK